MMTFLLCIDDEFRRKLEKPIRGDGGFQRLLKRLRYLMKYERGGWYLHITPRDAERIIRYADNYGDGGFQLRLPARSVKHAQQAHKHGAHHVRRRTASRSRVAHLRRQSVGR